MVVLKTEGLTKEYRTGFWRTRVRVLHDLNLEVHQGEIFGYLGPNGAGKTTTLKLLMGLIYPTAGRASILGQDVQDVAVKAQVGFLPENPYFYDYLTGREFLHFYGQLFGIPYRDRRQRIEELLGSEVEGIEITASGFDEAVGSQIAKWSVRPPVQHGDTVFFAVRTEKEASQVMEFLLGRGASVHAVHPKRRTLEDLFLQEVAKT